MIDVMCCDKGCEGKRLSLFEAEVHGLVAEIHAVLPGGACGDIGLTLASARALRDGLSDVLAAHAFPAQGVHP